ncbi:hypothetical protein THAOC_29521 [Thalassiosira oceanica]|uniref:Uncharacterized protein n=1 Tax=Thalassiosira oceanica TaxID=159749 RepID=K0RX70_THAOC|nr:hypothetical protein THAOC_29521 [Thalassiosira oceanica]|eukprot:EJK51317.1 hypothetical protein THAOC_29521 [Thalassiosira oceanica]
MFGVDGFPRAHEGSPLADGGFRGPAARGRSLSEATATLRGTVPRSRGSLRPPGLSSLLGLPFSMIGRLFFQDLADMTLTNDATTQSACFRVPSATHAMRTGFISDPPMTNVFSLSTYLRPCLFLHRECRRAPEGRKRDTRPCKVSVDENGASQLEKARYPEHTVRLRGRAQHAEDRQREHAGVPVGGGPVKITQRPTRLPGTSRSCRNQVRPRQRIESHFRPGFLVAQSTPGQWCAARASGAAPGAAPGGLGPQRPRLMSLADFLVFLDDLDDLADFVGRNDSLGLLLGAEVGLMDGGDDSLGLLLGAEVGLEDGGLVDGGDESLGLLLGVDVGLVDGGDDSLGLLLGAEVGLIDGDEDSLGLLLACTGTLAGLEVGLVGLVDGGDDSLGLLLGDSLGLLLGVNVGLVDGGDDSLGLLLGVDVGLVDGGDESLGLLLGAEVGLVDGGDDSLGLLLGAEVGLVDGGDDSLGLLLGVDVGLVDGGDDSLGLLLGAEVGLDDGGVVNELGLLLGAEVGLVDGGDDSLGLLLGIDVGLIVGGVVNSF